MEKTLKHVKKTTSIGDEVTHTFDLIGASMSDYWYYIDIDNKAPGEITFSNQIYGTCYTCIANSEITATASYKSGRSANDFIVSEGTLTNNGLVVSNVKENKKIIVMLNDYHDPQSDSVDDFGIFTDPDFSDYSQYRIVEGSDLMLSSYTIINSQPAALTDREIFEFNVGEIDLLGFNPANIPGTVKTKIACPDTNYIETVQNGQVAETIYPQPKPSDSEMEREL